MLLPCVLALALPTPQLPSGTTVLARHVFETEEGADLGTALERVGDWDGDGVDDYAVGSPGYDFPALFDSIDDHGRVQVRSGADDQVIAETIQLYEAGAARVGTAIAGPFDSDQDGNLELAVATGGFDEVLILERGGPDGSWLDVQTTLSATLTSILVEQGFGQVLENLGDVTGDGVDDLGIGSPLSDRFELAGTILDAGAVRIVSGADWSTRALWSYGDDRAKFGSALASVRDMSLDDRRDVAVGAPGLQNSSDDSEGRVYFLNANAFLTPPLLNTLTDGIAGNGFGASLLEVGDITGGTGSELLVGAMNFIAVLEGATFNFYVDQRAGELTLFELDSFQPLWKNSGQGAKLIDSRSMALGHVTGGGTEVVVLESWTTSSLPRIATLRLIDGAVTRRLDGAAAERSQHHSLAVVPSPNPDLRDSVVFGVPSMDFRGGILTYNIVESPPPTPPTQTWTVNADPGAGADFVGMVQASVIAAPGDTLLVAPGAYDYTGISRDLILLKDGSQPGAVFTLWLEVKEASRCHVEGFSPNRLSLGEISFRGTVEAVAALEIEVIDCNDMTVANCTFGPGDPGIEVVASYLQVRSTSASGGLLFTPGGGVGYYAMDVSGFGQVLAVDSQFYGADSAMGPPPFGSQTETSEAVRLGEFTHLDLRGDPSALLEGGTDPMGLVAPSRDLLIAPTATASISSSHQGVSWEGGGAVTLESDISPWLEYASSVDAGGTWDVVVRAELGVPVAFYVTAEPSFVTVPSLLGTPLLVDIATEIASTLETGAGLSTVQPTPSFPIPANPALVGLQLHLQGFVVGPDFLFEGTNGGALLIR